MNISKHSILGIVSAPLIPALSLSLASPGLGVTYAEPSSVLIFTIILYFPSASITALFGIPTYILLKRYNFIRWWSVSFIGFVYGALACSVFFGFRYYSEQDYRGLIIWSVSGAITAYVIWFYWQLGRKQTET